MEEKFIKWEPAELGNILTDAYFARTRQDENGFIIEVENRDGKVVIQFIFENGVQAYQCIDEGDRLKTVNFIANHYEKEFYTKWSLFKVENSKYLKWFNHENYNRYTNNPNFNIEHFVFLTDNDIVDVLSSYPPKIKIISK